MGRVRVVVDGRVQGVWFRDSCKRQAETAGVTGWVENLPDGRVQAEFQGDAEAVGRMIAWCRQGPPRAVVTHVDVQELAPIGGERGFRVR